MAAALALGAKGARPTKAVSEATKASVTFRAKDPLFKLSLLVSSGLLVVIIDNLPRRSPVTQAYGCGD